MRRLLLVLILMDLLLVASCGGGSSPPPTTGGGSGGGPVVLQSITINPHSASIAKGTTQAFTATGNYSDGTTKDLTTTAQWACFIPTVATVSSDSPTQGLATAVTPGTAVINASLGSVTNGAQLTVTSATVSSLAVTPATATIGFLDGQQFTATATFSDMSTQDVTNVTRWSFSPFGAFISSNSGFTTGNGMGTYTINASFGGQSTAALTSPPTLTVDLSNLVSVAIEPAASSIANSTQVRFSAIGIFSDGSTRDVTSLATNWSSSDTTVAGKVSFGLTPVLFAGVTAGSTTISASVGTFTPSTTLTVTDATLQSIAVSPANASLAPTTKLPYTAIGTFSDSSTEDVSSLVKWSVQDVSGAASVDTGGIVRGSSAGTVTVTATSPSTLGSVAGSTNVTVTAGTLQSIAVTPATAFIVPGNNLTYSAIATFSDSSTQDVTTLASWTATSGNVATIPGGNKSSVVTAQGLGQSTIEAKWNGISGTANLTVASPTQISIAVTPAKASVAAGASTQLTATGTFVDGTTQDFTTLVNWSSSAPTAATVDYQTGLVSGLIAASSPVTITATLGPVTGTTQVAVQ